MSQLGFLFDPEDAEEAIQRAEKSIGGVKLRPYQVEAVDAVFREWEHVSSTLVTLPTGCGKSVVFAEVMRRWIEQAK